MSIRNMLLRNADLRRITNLRQQLDQQENLSPDASRSLVALLQVAPRAVFKPTGSVWLALGLFFLCL